MKNTIFLSYSWKDKSTADAIDRDLRKFGLNIKKDERDLKYKSDIKKFMTSLKESDFIIPLISDSYLRSPNCMFEIGELLKMENYKSKTLQIILPDAKIFKIHDKYDYLNYWQKEYLYLSDKLKENFSDANINIIKNDLIHYKDIITNLPNFLEFITSEKALTLTDLSKNKYTELLDKLGFKNKKFDDLLFSESNINLLPLEHFKNKIGKTFKGIVKRHFGYGIFIRVFSENGYREGLLHKSNIEKDYFISQIRNYFTYGSEIEVILTDINFETPAANISGGLGFKLSKKDEFNEILHAKINKQLLLVKKLNFRTFDLSGCNLDEIPKALYEIKSLESLDLTNNELNDQSILFLFDRINNLKIVYKDNFQFIKDLDSKIVHKLKYK